MALPRPILDNRSFADLKDELVKRIPVYTPEWTDHNESDPGITLLELFAFLGESLLYRFNQIPESTRIEFLRLLGVQPRPAQTARVLLAATTEEPRGVQVLRDSEVMSGAIAFQTDDEVYAWPLDVVATGKTRRRADPATLERRREALTRAGLNEKQAAFYTTTVVSSDPLEPDATVVDVSTQLDQALWVALLAKPTTNLAELRGGTLFVGLALDEELDPPPLLRRIARPPRGSGGQRLSPNAAFLADELTIPPPPMLWRLWNGRAPGGTGPLWNDLRVLGDTTRGLLTSGVVKLQLPRTLPVLTDASAAAGSANGPGAGESPPPLPDEEDALRVVGWLQVRRPRTADIGDAIGRVRWVGLNAVGAVQARTAAPELIGTGTGDGDQRCALNHRPVISGSVHLEVEEATGWTAWTEVESFVASGLDDRHYQVDRDSATIVFGRHLVPQIGERIRVLDYRYGGGSAGNVRAGTVTDLTSGGAVKVSNPLDAVGGSDAVRLDEALEAIPAEVHRHDRAVVTTDFEELAEQVAGVARASAMPRFHPDAPGVEAAGVMTVVVWPERDLRNPGAPMPELGLLRRVARFLDARRLITTELYVVPPEYVKVSVSVGVQVREGYQVDAIRRWVEQILRQYLGSLPPSGPDGDGWPLGRRIRRAELEAVAVQVEGVAYVEDLLLAWTADRTPVQEILLEAWQVAAVAELAVVSGQPLALGASYAPPAPARIPLPLPPDEC